MRTSITRELEQRVTSYYNQDNTMEKCAAYFKIALTTVYNILHRNKIFIRPRRKISDKILLEEFENYHNEEGLTALSQRLGISDTQVMFHFKRLLPDRYYLTQRRKSTINDDIFDDLGDDDAAWLLGWIWSDGTVHNKSNYVRISYHIKDAELDEKFRLLTGGKPHLKESCHDFFFTSRKIKQKLISIGCVPSKSLTIMMPQNAPNLNMPAFFRGLFEGDGWVCTGHGGRALYVGISSGNKAFVQQLQDYFSTMGVNTLIHTGGGSWGQSYSLRFRGTENSAKFLSFIYPGTEKNYLSRKRNKFLEWKKTCNDRKN